MARPAHALVRLARKLLGTEPRRPIRRGGVPLRLEYLDERITPAALIKDINAIVNTTGSNPQNLISLGTVTFFTATTVWGTELWRSDGTPTGTVLVKDIYSGLAGSSPLYLTNVNGTLFFTATDGVNGPELWKSDGTSAGTTLVKDILTGVSGSSPGNLMNLNGTLVFTAHDPGLGRELWMSDGTTAGTVLLKDIYSGANPSLPRYLTNVNGTLFFRATDGVTGYELWRSDGTTAGTVLVKDILAGATGSSPASLTNVGGTLFFTATDGVNGGELWRSDGTAAGTVLVKDIRAGATGSSPASLTNVGGTLFFTATDGVNGAELWKSDGTTGGTVLVKDILAGATGSSPVSLTNVGGTLFFTATDGVNGAELWKSDGTTAGTVLVKDLNPGNSNSFPRYLTNVNGTMFFRATDGVTGYELWRSDGTAAGTVLVKDILTGGNSSNPRYMTNVGGTLFFQANDGTNGTELWRSDGTPAGTTLVKNIRTGSSSSPRIFLNVNGTLFFQANDGIHGYELWRSDGTSAGTTLVKDIRTGSGNSYPGTLTNVNGLIYFQASDGVNGYELWRSDGTSAGTTLVKDIRTGSSNSAPTSLTNVNGTLFFRADDGVNGTELWKSDGTAVGTVLVKDIRTGGDGSNPATLTNVNGTLFFRATNWVNGYQLWKSDGSAAGTSLVGILPNGGELSASPGANPGLTYLRGELNFSALSDDFGLELWKETNIPPAITSDGGGATAQRNVVENTTVVATVVAFDESPAIPLAFIISGGADAARFAINPSTGVLTFVAATNFEAPTDANTDNVYEVTVQASNGVAVDTQAISVTVTDQAHALATVYVDDDWAALPDGTPITDADPSIAGNQPAVVGATAFGVLERGIDSVSVGGMVVLNAGTYAQAANLAVPFSLKVTGAATISGVLSGPALMTKGGNGALTLSGVNTFTGGIGVDRGQLRVAADSALGASSGSVTVGTLGTLVVTASTTSSRAFDLGLGALQVSSGASLNLNGADVGGGFLSGPGTIATGPATTLTGSTIRPSLAVTANTGSTFTNVSNEGSMTVPLGQSIAFDGFVSEATGNLVLAGTAAAADFLTYGQMTVLGTLTNTGTSGLGFGGGSVTTINVGGSVNIGAADAAVAGGLIRNNGSLGSGTNKVIADYGSRVAGTGTFGTVETRNGGVFAPGSSPGTATTDHYLVNPGGTLEFEISNATGTAGQLSGWDLVLVRPTTFSPASAATDQTATAGAKYNIRVITRLDSGDRNTAGAASNFNPILPYAWKFADASDPAATVTGTFNPAMFGIDTTGVANSFTGNFSVELRDGGRNLYLVYTPAPVLMGVLVNGTTAPSAALTTSRVTSLTLSFNTPVTVDPAAFSLTNGTSTITSAAGGAISVAGGGTTTLTLTFTGSSGVDFTSLADGVWTLTTDMTKVRNAATTTGTGTVTTNHIRRLYGDIDGNGVVNSDDFDQFGNTFGLAVGEPGFLLGFDFDDNGVINSDDFDQFGNRFGIAL